MTRQSFKISPGFNRAPRRRLRLCAPFHRAAFLGAVIILWLCAIAGMAGILAAWTWGVATMLQSVQ